MVFFTRAALLALLTLMARASPLLGQRAANLGPLSILENITIPSGWTPTGSPNPETLMTMQVALKQKNIDGLQAKLMDVSDPESPNYGKCLSKEDMEAYTSPSTDSLQTVKLWLASYGVPASSISQPTPDWMEVSVPISKAEIMLNTKDSLIYDTISGRTVPRTSEYSIPLLLLDHVDTIQPTTAFHRSMGPQLAQNSTEGHNKRQSGCVPNNSQYSRTLSSYPRLF
jgi:hypothetical protein